LSRVSFYDWQFREGPENGGRNRSIVVVDKENEIAGFMGVNNRTFYLGGRCLKGTELITWLVSEEIQGRGYGKAVLEYLKARYDVVLGGGISSMAVPVYTRQGFRYFRYIPRYVRIFDPDAIRSISNISELGLKMIEQYSSIPRIPYEANRISYSDAGQFAKTLHTNFNCFGRGVEYLEWRYKCHPVYRYDILRVASPGEAAVILRADEKDYLKIVHVVDVLGEEDALPGVLSFVEDYCRDMQADLCDFYCMSDRMGHVFRYYGWFSAVDDFYIQVPHLFHPIDMRDPPTTSLIIWARDDLSSLLDGSRLHVTKGDFDLDRPTVDYLEAKGISL
jgi:GNAT superfamily N-acetyltransferase